MAGDFVLDWEKALGFKSDPFADKVLEPASQFLVNRIDEKEKVNWFFIKGYFYGRIVGEHGVGKTTFLKWLEERLNRYNKIHCVYINAAVFREQINIPYQILSPLLTFYERHWSKPHQKVVNFDYVGFIKRKLGQRSVALLVDNAHNLTDRNLELLKSLREEGLKLQVIVATTQPEFEKSRLSELGSDELNITLRRLTFEESKELIRKRVAFFGGSGIEPFREETLRELYDKADKNPRQYLHLCRDEAIRILIRRQDKPDERPARPAVQAQPQHHHLQPSQQKMRFGRKKPVEQGERIPQSARSTPEPARKEQGQVPEMPKPDFRFRREEPKAKAPKKKLFNIKFDFGSGKAAGNSKKVAMPGHIYDQKQLYSNDKYRQDLIDKLASAGPKKSQEKESVSDIDKMLRDLSDEF